MAKKPDVAPALAGDQQLITAEAGAISTFVKNVLQFLSTAAAIERDAKAQVAVARALQPPKTADEDTRVKDNVRVFGAKKKAAEDHWNVCAEVSRFHRRLTAGRARAVDPLDEAITIGTRLHADYVTAERRKAEEVERRLREQAEQAAREQHEAELRQLEAEALALEAQNDALSGREQLFVDEWIETGGNAQQAARVAGYKDVVAAVARLSNSVKIKNAIEAATKAQALRRQEAAVRATPVETPDIRIEAAVDTNGDRTRGSADLVDEPALIAAILAGKHGIPSDLLSVNRPKLNEYARALGVRIELWPGVRFVRKTTIV